MSNFFIIFLASFVAAAALERLDFEVLSVLVAWVGFLIAMSQWTHEPYESQGEKTIFGIIIGFVLVISTIEVFSGVSNKPPSYTTYTSPQPNYFYGYECTGNCSGHEAGYDWAKDNQIRYASDCSGNSESFVEGCEAWVKNSPE